IIHPAFEVRIVAQVGHDGPGEWRVILVDHDERQAIAGGVLRGAIEDQPERGGQQDRHQKTEDGRPAIGQEKPNVLSGKRQDQPRLANQAALRNWSRFSGSRSSTGSVCPPAAIVRSESSWTLARARVTRVCPICSTSTALSLSWRP